MNYAEFLNVKEEALAKANRDWELAASYKQSDLDEKLEIFCRFYKDGFCDFEETEKWVRETLAGVGITEGYTLKPYNYGDVDIRFDDITDRVLLRVMFRTDGLKYYYHNGVNYWSEVMEMQKEGKVPNQLNLSVMNMPKDKETQAMLKAFEMWDKTKNFKERYAYWKCRFGKKVLLNGIFRKNVDNKLREVIIKNKEMQEFKDKTEEAVKQKYEITDKEFKARIAPYISYLQSVGAAEVEYGY